jgi:hypothetical protein
MLSHVVTEYRPADDDSGTSGAAGQRNRMTG